MRIVKMFITSLILLLSISIIIPLEAHAVPVEPMPTIGVWASGTAPAEACSSTTAGCGVSFVGSVGSGWGRVDVEYIAAAAGGERPYAGALATIGGEQWYYNSTSAEARNIYAFYIEPIGNVDGIPSIPVDFSFSMWLTASAYFDVNNQIVANSTASAKISVTDYLNNPWAGNIYGEAAGIVGSSGAEGVVVLYENTGTKDLSLYPNKWYLVAVDAYAYAVKNQWGGVPGGYYSSGSRADVDPTIVIDPTWQYADSFRVVQFSVEPPPSAVPEPSTLLLVGSSMAGFAAISALQRLAALRTTLGRKEG